MFHEYVWLWNWKVINFWIKEENEGLLESTEEENENEKKKKKGGGGGA